jgi:NAD(P)-dependent dehydrogenase (short-subunit alcohol dehydrogenase family)
VNKAVLITGTNGGIGAELKKIFSEEGYAVIGLGKSPDNQACSDYIQVDFARIASDAKARATFVSTLNDLLSNYALVGLINNSAVQILAPLGDLVFEDFIETMNVNVAIPFLLAKACLSALEGAHGSVVNIGSIHGKLTKPNFVAYATSKGALETMTKAMAVDIGSKVRVNLIAPAAIETEMLKAGFQGEPDKYQQLRSFHPANAIGSPREVALLAFRLIDDNMPFLNGAVIDMTGAISNRLHDPD